MGYPVFALGDKWEPTDANAVGLWLIKSQTIGTGVAGVEVTGAFSSSYDNYRIVVSGMGSNGNNYGGLFFLGTYGAAGYYGTMTYYTIGVGQNFLPSNNTQSVYAFIQATDASTSIVMDICNPNKAARTSWSGAGFGNQISYTFSGKLDNATQYTSFQLAAGVGTLTGGTIRVYGYRN